MHARRLWGVVPACAGCVAARLCSRVGVRWPGSCLAAVPRHFFLPLGWRHWPFFFTWPVFPAWEMELKALGRFRTADARTCTFWLDLVSSVSPSVLYYSMCLYSVL